MLLGHDRRHRLHPVVGRQSMIWSDGALPGSRIATGLLGSYLILREVSGLYVLFLNNVLIRTAPATELTSAESEAAGDAHDAAGSVNATSLATRDYFAGQALIGLLRSRVASYEEGNMKYLRHVRKTAPFLAETCYMVADELVSAAQS